MSWFASRYQLCYQFQFLSDMYTGRQQKMAKVNGSLVPMWSAWIHFIAHHFSLVYPQPLQVSGELLLLFCFLGEVRGAGGKMGDRSDIGGLDCLSSCPPTFLPLLSPTVSPLSSPTPHAHNHCCSSAFQR